MSNSRTYDRELGILPEQPIKKYKIFPLPLQWWVNSACSGGKNMCKTTWWYVLTGKHKGQKKILGRP